MWIWYQFEECSRWRNLPCSVGYRKQNRQISWSGQNYIQASDDLPVAEDIQNDFRPTPAESESAPYVFLNANRKRFTTSRFIQIYNKFLSNCDFSFMKGVQLENGDFSDDVSEESDDVGG